MRDDFLVPSIGYDTKNLVLVLFFVLLPRSTIVDFENLVRRQARMDVYRHAQSFGTCEHGLEIRMVEELFPDDSVGQRAKEAIFPNCAFQFVR